MEATEILQGSTLLCHSKGLYVRKGWPKLCLFYLEKTHNPNLKLFFSCATLIYSQDMLNLLLILQPPFYLLSAFKHAFAACYLILQLHPPSPMLEPSCDSIFGVPHFWASVQNVFYSIYRLLCGLSVTRRCSSQTAKPSSKVCSPSASRRTTSRTPTVSPSRGFGEVVRL